MGHTVQTYPLPYQPDLQATYSSRSSAKDRDAGCFLRPIQEGAHVHTVKYTRIEHTYTCQSVRVPVFKFSTNAISHTVASCNLQVVVSREDPAEHVWVLMALLLQALHDSRLSSFSCCNMQQSSDQLEAPRSKPSNKKRKRDTKTG